MMVKKSDLEEIKSILLPPLPEEVSFVVAEEMNDHPHKFWVGRDYLGHVAIPTLVVALYGSHTEHSTDLAKSMFDYMSQDDREDNKDRSKVIVKATYLKDRTDPSISDRSARHSPLVPASQLIYAFKNLGYEHGVQPTSSSHPMIKHGIRPEHIKEMDISGSHSNAPNQIQTEPYVVLGKASSNAKEGFAYARGDMLGYYALNLVLMNQSNFAKLHGVDRYRTPAGSASILHHKENGDISLLNISTGPTQRS